MHVMIEAYLAPNASAEGLLSQETLDDTQAQVMTPDEAKALGIGGLPDDEADRRLIVVAKIDARRIMNALEGNPNVARFRLHEVDL
jgi:hypothetical protein